MEADNVTPYRSVSPPSTPQSKKPVAKPKKSTPLESIREKAAEELHATKKRERPLHATLKVSQTKEKQIFESSARSGGYETKPKTSQPLTLIREPIPPHIANYLDENRLLMGPRGAPSIDPSHRDWFLNQAAILEQISGADEETQKKLMLLILNAYSKAATISEVSSTRLGIQGTPILPEDDRYHRSTGNLILETVGEAYAKDIGMQSYEVEMITSPLLLEVIARELPQADFDLRISSLDEFEQLLVNLLTDAMSDKFPTDEIVLDLSQFIKLGGIAPGEINALIVQRLENILINKLKEYRVANPQADMEQIADRLLSKLHLIAFTEHKGQPLLLMPAFFFDPHPRFDSEINALLQRRSLKNKHGEIHKIFYDMIRRHGYRPSPDQTKEAWLKVKNPQEILEELNITKTTMTHQGAGIPKVCPSCSQFIEEPVIAKFRDLKKVPEGGPYLKVLPEATYLLLKGLAEYKNEEGGIDQVYKEKGIEGLLQQSYFRIQNAMNEAILRRDDFIAFYNQIELIHQEIQNILAIVEPYDQDVLAQSVKGKMQGGSHPVVSDDLELNVQIMPSAMHGVSSVLASVEAEKGSNSLNVAVLKDSYYESSDTLKHAKTHSLHVVNGDEFNKAGIEAAFNRVPTQPLDLFVCEFHHNISTDRQVYRPEDIAGQVKALVDKGMVADKFTVLIDTTMDLEQSKDVRKFLSDEGIKKMIEEGKLNVVLARSTQKFDMLGIDNYYGGITMAVNNGESFSRFNSRMNEPADQLTGLSYQGVAHLQKYGGRHLDLYRQGIMENTHKLYNKLPSAAIYYEGTQNPMQISKIEDKKLFFLDIKFPLHKKAAEAFKERLREFAMEENLPLTTRPSFGFANTNVTSIDKEKFRLTPGLDSIQTLERYAVFFKAIQDTIDDVMKKGGSPEEIDVQLSKRIHSLVI